MDQTHFHTHQLSDVYDAVATKFSQTRSKFQHSFELDQICRLINAYRPASQAPHIRILELGCGDGRLYAYLKKHCIHDFTYTGVDISQSMIKLADQSYPETNRIIDDMNIYLQNLQPLELDIVVSVATYQHLPTDTHRTQHLQSIYQALSYGGLCLMTNRSRSYRMCRKYWKRYLKSCVLFVMTLGYHNDRNDMYIPFGLEGKVYERYYHIFLLSELKTLYRRAGFVIQTACHIDKGGNLTQSRTYAKNTLISGIKDVILEGS